jgi:hypothetical protein
MPHWASSSSVTGATLTPETGLNFEPALGTFTVAALVEGGAVQTALPSSTSSPTDETSSSEESSIPSSASLAGALGENFLFLLFTCISCISSFESELGAKYRAVFFEAVTLRRFDGPGTSSSEDGNEGDRMARIGDAALGVGWGAAARSACAANAAFLAARAEVMVYSVETVSIPEILVRLTDLDGAPHDVLIILSLSRALTH